MEQTESETAVAFEFKLDNALQKCTNHKSKIYKILSGAEFQFLSEGTEPVPYVVKILLEHKQYYRTQPSPTHFPLIKVTSGHFLYQLGSSTFQKGMTTILFGKS